MTKTSKSGRSQQYSGSFFFRWNTIFHIILIGQVHVDATHSDTRSVIHSSLSLYVSIHPLIQLVTGLLMVFSVDVRCDKPPLALRMFGVFRFHCSLSDPEIAIIRDKNETPIHSVIDTFLTPNWRGDWTKPEGYQKATKLTMMGQDGGRCDGLMPAWCHLSASKLRALLMVHFPLQATLDVVHPYTSW